MKLPEIVYFQTLTACNGHCHYCPFDDVYRKNVLPQASMKFSIYQAVIKWLADQGYIGRLGFLLHYEPSLDNRLPDWIAWTRQHLPLSAIEIATNGLKQPPELWNAVDIIDWVLPGKQTRITSRAGNVKMCEELKDRKTFSNPPCSLPYQTMCLAATGEFLLCCQDWRHEAVIGTWRDIAKARLYQLECAHKNAHIEMCQDCMAGLCAEEVGDRLGNRHL